MLCRKFGWLSVKVLQIKERRLKLFGCSSKPLAMCDVLRLVSRVPASYFTYLDRNEHKCFLSLQSSFCILHLVCGLLLVCSLHFTHSLHFTPGPQSAVWSTQSAFYTGRFANICMKAVYDNEEQWHRNHLIIWWSLMRIPADNHQWNLWT